jgi:rhodanese-related sulfurtransferase
MRSIRSYCFVLLSMVFFASCGQYDTFPKERSSGLDEPAALKALIDEGQTVNDGDFRIVDVRPEDKYARGHIPTATNLPKGKLDTGNPLPPRDKMIIVYCETGGRAQMAAKKMGKAGYNHIFNWGGFRNWPYEPEKEGE